MSLLDHPEAQALLNDATVFPDTVRDCADHLTGFLDRYLPKFYRAEQRQNATLVIRGLLSGLERKTCEPIAIAAGVPRKPIQFFVGAGLWDDEAVMGELRLHVRETLAEPDGVVVIDPSGFPKKGTESCGVRERPKREDLLRAARRRELDLILVWRLDRWGRSLVDLVTTLQELTALQVGFVSLSEALDLTTPSGRALAGMLAVFAEFERDILRDRVKAGIAQARKEGRPHGRPQTITRHAAEVKNLFQQGVSKREIAKTLGISRTSVRRFLG